MCCIPSIHVLLEAMLLFSNIASICAPSAAGTARLLQSGFPQLCQMCICTKLTLCIIFQLVCTRFHSLLLSNAAEAAEFPARRRAGGPSFRSSTNPAAFHVNQGNSDTAHMHRNSVPAVERSEDSPRDVHRPRDMARQSMPVMRNLMSRSRSRDRTASAAAEEQVRSLITCCCSHTHARVCVRVCVCVGGGGLGVCSQARIACTFQLHNHQCTLVQI